MSRVAATIGTLVMEGYMASMHEDIIYLHKSNGERWAQIEPYGMGMTLTLITDEGTPRYCGASGIETTADLLDLLDAAESVGAA